MTIAPTHQPQTQPQVPCRTLATASGSAATGVVAALSRQSEPGDREATPPRDPSSHAVILPRSRYGVEIFHDGRLVRSGRIGPGSLHMVPAGEAARVVRTDGWTALRVQLPVAYVSDLVRTDGDVGRPEAVEFVRRDPPDHAVVDRIGRDLVAEMRHGRPLGRLKVDTLAQELAIFLLRHNSNLPGADSFRSRAGRGLAPWQLRRVTEYMADRLDHDVGLTELAQQVGLSPNHFCTAFRRTTGRPPTAWLLEQRIARAKTLMLDKRDASLTEIALAVGYASQSAFGAAFRRTTGETPSRWRADRK